MPVYMNSGKIVAGRDRWTGGESKVLQEVLADLKKMLSRIIKSFFVFISRGGKQRRKNLFDFISLLRESIQPFTIVNFVAK